INDNIPIFFRLGDGVQRRQIQSPLLLAVRRVEQVITGAMVLADLASFLVERLGIELLAGFRVENVLGHFCKGGRLLTQVAVFAEESGSYAGVGERGVETLLLRALFYAK